MKTSTTTLWTASLAAVVSTFAAATNTTLAVPGPFVPPGDDILLIVGQDTTSIDDYHAAVGVAPGGVTGYINLSDLSGLTTDADNGAGPNNMGYLFQQYPNSTLAIGVYLVGQLPQINSGGLDGAMDELIRILKSWERPIFLRWGYEFDGPWNAYDPGQYIDAWRRMYGRIQAAGATNIAMVWQSATWCGGTYNGQSFQAWWPGNQFVDWVGLSYFAPQDCGNSAIDPVVSFARDQNKPLMIAESAPQRYDIGALTYSNTINANDQLPRTASQIWNEWFAPYLDFIARNGDVIKAVAYINADWDNQPRWGPPYSEGYWGDSRVQANTIIRSRWLEEVTSSRWLNASPDLFEILTGSPVPPPPPSPGCSADAIDLRDTVSYSSTNAGEFSVSSDGCAMTLTNNIWRRTSAELTVNADTVLRFMFSSDGAGEIQGIGMDEDTSASPNRVFRLAGSQNWGIADFAYTGNGAPQQFSIPIGEYYTGQMGIVIANDNDASNGNGNTVTVSDVVLSARGAPSPPGAAFGIDANGALYHEDNGWTAGFVYLCLNADCRPAVLSGGRYERSVSVSPGQSYTIEFKVQDDASGQCLSGVQTVVYQTGGVSAPSLCD